MKDGSVLWHNFKPKEELNRPVLIDGFVICTHLLSLAFAICICALPPSPLFNIHGRFASSHCFFSYSNQHLQSSIYLCFNLKSNAYISIVFLLEILSMQFMKYSLCNLEFIKIKTHKKSNEREREMVVRHKGNDVEINFRPPPQLVSNH